MAKGLGQWVVISGLVKDKDANGAVGENKGEREDGWHEVKLGVESVLVKEGNLKTVPWVGLPGGWVVSEGSSRPPNLPERRKERFMAFTDPEGDEIVLSGWEGSGKGMYSVNGRWRPEFHAAEIFAGGREGWKGCHIRFHCCSVFKNVPVPEEIVEKVVKFLNLVGVPHSMRKFSPGDSVRTLEAVTFSDGDEVRAGTHGVVLQQNPDADSPLYEICLASGEHFDVAAHQIAPLPPLLPSVPVVLQREVRFESTKDPVAPSTLLTYKSASKGNLVEVRSPTGLVFDVSKLWLRPLEGPRLS